MRPPCPPVAGTRSPAAIVSPGLHRQRSASRSSAISTPYEIIERPFTEGVRSEFIGRGHFTVLPQDTGVDAVLKGDIIGLSITPAAFDDQQQASRYTITVVARMEFRDLKSNNVLWDNPSLVYREEYDSAQGTSALDPNAFFGQEADALRRVSSEFARSVVSSILEAF